MGNFTVGKDSYVVQLNQKVREKNNGVEQRIELRALPPSPTYDRSDGIVDEIFLVTKGWRRHKPPIFLPDFPKTNRGKCEHYCHKTKIKKYKICGFHNCAESQCAAL